MSIANIILDQELRYLDAKYNLVCRIIQEFFKYYDKELYLDNDLLNVFVCEYSKEIDDIIKDFENNKE